MPRVTAAVAVVLAMASQDAIGNERAVTQNTEPQRAVEVRRAVVERLREIQRQLQLRQALRAEEERSEALRIRILELRRALQAASGVPTVRDVYGRTLPLAKVVTVAFRNAEVSDVLEWLGQSAGVTVRFAEGVDVRGPVTLSYRDVPVATVFNHVLDAAGLSLTLLDEQTLLVASKQ